MFFRKKTVEPEESPAREEEPAPQTDLTIITYDSKSAQAKTLAGVDELAKYKSGSKTTWINVSGLHDVDAVKRIGELYDIHPLTIEDVLNTKQQPKIEIFKEYKFLSIKTIQKAKPDESLKDWEKSFRFFRRKEEQDEEVDEFLIDQISLIVMKNVLITFQEIPGDPFDAIRKKIADNSIEIRSKGTDHLAYMILDAVVDEYFITLNSLEDDIEDYEDRAIKISDDMFFQEIQDTKKYLLQIKRAISPLKDIMLTIINRGLFFKTEEFKPFLQDLNDHLNNFITMVDNLHEWLANIMDVNLSVLSHQTNKVMKVLAMISTIFIPLTFIAGVYGMNFDFMPELRNELGYPVVLGVMVFIAVTMIIIFKKRRWF